MQQVKDVMLRDTITVQGLTKVSEILEIFKKQTELQTVLVKPRNDEDVYGLVTLRDIARKVIALGKKSNEVHAYEIMSKPVLTVNANMSVMYAARFLTNFDISRAIVMENDKLVGIISLNHIVLKCKLD
ncbi:MAG TPA: CBS domain-containing protein [Nitrospinota bacterium]|jgi:CBS domain-containing protein|nr:CBS domain-containing protein [Nitrospinota bacterium]HJN02831.1 CBS domain-containing protein [Nitrospinota bacterium]